MVHNVGLREGGRSGHDLFSSLNERKSTKNKRNL